MSRFTGLLRTWVMAYALGATCVASAYQVSNNLPNIIYETIAGGLIAAAFLPVLMLVMEKRGRDGASEYASTIFNLSLIVLGLVSLLGAIFAEPLMATQTFTVDASESEVVPTAVWLFRVFSVQVLFYGLAGVVQGVLNANRIYLVTAIAPAVNNLIVIASLVAYSVIVGNDASTALTVLAVGTTLGVFAQFACQLPSIRRTGLRWRPVLRIASEDMRETVRIAMPTIVFVLASIVGMSCKNAFALGASDAGPAIVAYAFLWFQLPYGIVAVSLSRTMFTEMSEASAKGDMESLRRYVSCGLLQTIALMIPFAVALFFLAMPLMGILQTGAFTAEDVAASAELLSVWAIGLPFYAVFMYLYNAFAAIRRFLPYAIMNVALTGLLVALYWLLSSPDVLGLQGIAAADVIYYALYAAGSYVLMRWIISKSAPEAGLDKPCKDAVGSEGR